MARFLNIEEHEIQRRKKKDYLNPTNQYRLLSNCEEDTQLIKRYRFSREGINFICRLVKDDLIFDARGKPVPIETQVECLF